MASPPFNIAQTEPAASDFISQYPTNEQTNRDVIESWLLLISTTSGVLRADAMPSVFGVGEVFDTSVYIDAANTTADAELVLRDETDVVQARLIWDESEDVLKIITYQDDGTTPRNTLLIANDAATFTFNASNILTAASTDAAAITGTGALNAGSITSGFGSIDIGVDALTAGAISGTTGTFSSTLGVTGVLTATGGIELQNTDTTLTRLSAGIMGVEGKQVLDVSTQNQPVTGGATHTSLALNGGSPVSSGTLTLDVGDASLQHYTNGGAHTLAPGTVTGHAFIDITNNASAGAITTSGFTKVDGGTFTTTNGHKFRCSVSVANAGSLLIVQAMQ